MKKISLLILLGICYNSFSQDTKVKYSSLRFLLLDTDGRSTAMGNNGVATSTDVNSIFHNAAKMVFSNNKKSIVLNHSPWSSSISKDIFLANTAFINKIDANSSFGVDFKYFSLGKVTLTDNQGSDIGSENPNEFALSGAYAMKLSELFSMGVTLKYINSNFKISSLDSNFNTVHTIGIDVSGLYESKKIKVVNSTAKYRFGFNFANLGPKISYVNGESNFIPVTLKLGSGFDYDIYTEQTFGCSFELSELLVPEDSKSQKGSFEGAISTLSKTKLSDLSFGIGTEYKYQNTFALRVGYFNESENSGYRNFISFGAGIKTKSLTFNFSYLVNNRKQGNILNNPLNFSIAYIWN